jgi:hypothetical protein
MKRRVLCAMLVGVMLFMGIGIWGQETSGKAAGKLPWGLYQEALRWQTLFVPFAPAPEQELLLLTSKGRTEEELTQLVEAGYVLKAVVGTMVLVSAPITLYIDQEKGLLQFDFVTMALYPIENWPTGGNLLNLCAEGAAPPCWEGYVAPEGETDFKWEQWLLYE